MSAVKVHYTAADHRGRIKTACGREGSLCRGFTPSPGHPGEYDTSICDRIESTPHDEDVTCARCLKRKR
jgi:hypothetical protein